MAWFACSTLPARISLPLRDVQDLQKPKSSLRVAQVRQVFWGHASAAVLPPPSKPPIEGMLSRVR